jgi:hypothetical protein
MSDDLPERGTSLGLPVGVLLSCAALLAAGYAAAVLRGPAPAREVRVVMAPSPEPAPEPAPPAE